MNINQPSVPAQNKNSSSAKYMYAFGWGLVLFISTVWASSHDSSKCSALFFMIAAFIACISFRKSIKIPTAVFGIVSLYTLTNGITSLYADAGKYALAEYLKILIGFSLFVLIILFSRKFSQKMPDLKSGWVASVAFETAAAIASVISIDLVSTRIISGLFGSFISIFTSGYENINGLEVGSRITTIYQNPNVFAGIMGLSVFISLGLAISAKTKGERNLHLGMLFCCALGFVLSFSIGAFFMFVPALVVYFLIEKKDRVSDAFFITFETLIIAFVSAYVTYSSVFHGSAVLSPVPLVALILGAAVLCLVDNLSSTFFKSKNTVFSNAPLVLLCIAGVCVVYAVCALNITGSLQISPSENVRRTQYLSEGHYTMSCDSDSAVNVIVESQNQADLVKHTSTILYKGSISDAEFDVAADSKIVSFIISADNNAVVKRLSCSDGTRTNNIKLNYILVPGFISNRLQGIFANENAIQRFEFFKDGLKISAKNPVFGLGLGSFQNWIQSVQDFHYETKYSHNHYIEMLLQGGIIGFAVFAALLVIPAICIIKELKKGSSAHDYSAVLGGALLFMALHALIEVNLSMIFYIPFAFCLFAITELCVGENLKLDFAIFNKYFVSVFVPSFLALFTIIVGLNAYAKYIAYQNSDTFEGQMKLFERAAAIDMYENADYMLTYITLVRQYADYTNQDMLVKASKYAQKMSSSNSRTIPRYLAEYYWQAGEPDKAFSFLCRYVELNKSSEEAWQTSFDILSTKIFLAGDYVTFRQGVLDLYARLLELNESRMESLSLSDKNLEFIHALQ